jgi:hypothetical protein
MPILSPELWLSLKTLIFHAMAAAKSTIILPPPKLFIIHGSGQDERKKLVFYPL